MKHSLVKQIKNALTSMLPPKRIDLELLFLIRNNCNLHKIERALSQGANPNATDFHWCAKPGEEGYTSLHEAASWFDPENVNKAGEPTRTALINLLLSHGANVNAKSKYGHFPLHFFAMKQDVAPVEILLKAGALPNVYNSSGETPLHSAAHFGTAQIVKLLLDHGADVNSRKPYDPHKCDGRTPLHCAICTQGDETDRINIIDILRKYGADLSIETGKWGHITPLKYAEEHMELIKHGSNPSESDRERSIKIMEKILNRLRA